MHKFFAIILCISLFISQEAFSQPSSSLRACVDSLCSESFGGRGRINTAQGATSYLDNSGHDAAAQYIASRFKEALLSPLSCRRDFPENNDYIATFPMHDSHGDGIDVIGFFPGMGKIPVNSYVIVGAHYDNLGIIRGRMYPGADSNASGVAALCEVADYFSSMRASGRYYSSSIIFVAFDCYFDGRSGSGWLYEKLSRGEIKDPVTGVMVDSSMVSMMIDLDQIGSSLAPLHPHRGDYLLVLGADSLCPCQKAFLSGANTRGLDLGFDYYGSRNFTKTFYSLGDRKWFIASGVPTLYFTSGITRFNNSVEDTPPTLDYEVFERRIDFLCRFIGGVL